MSSAEMIGQGSYGCVFKGKGIECADGKIIDHTKEVVKVQLESDAQKELGAYKKVQEFEHYTTLGKYAILNPRICKPAPTDDFKQLIENSCDGAYNSNKKTYDKFTRENSSLLIYEDGGENLVTYLTKRYMSENDIDKYNFFNSLTNLIHGLLFFKEHNKIHCDIKGENIVYNKSTTTAKFIDLADFTDLETAKNTVDTGADEEFDYIPRERFYITKEEWGGEEAGEDEQKYLDKLHARYGNEENGHAAFVHELLESWDLYSLTFFMYNMAYYIIQNDTDTKFIEFGENLENLTKNYISFFTERYKDIRLFLKEYKKLLRELVQKVQPSKYQKTRISRLDDKFSGGKRRKSKKRRRPTKKRKPKRRKPTKKRR